MAAASMSRPPRIDRTTLTKNFNRTHVRTYGHGYITVSKRYWRWWWRERWRTV